MIALDKSWLIRMGVLDILAGRTTIVTVLSGLPSLSSDLKALLSCAKTWNTDKPINVGESGTLYRLLRFASWKLGLDKSFIKEGTLLLREISDDAGIVGWSQEKLLSLDGGTSQWASAAVICGDPHRVESPPFKLKLTYEAVDHWKSNQPWVVRYDTTIFRQAADFARMLCCGKSTAFQPEQAEDYCYARAFSRITMEQGRRLWPQLVNHESNRLEEMERYLVTDKEGVVTSKDHRVVQALAMRDKFACAGRVFLNKDCVAKSWPSFWKFLRRPDFVEVLVCSDCKGKFQAIDPEEWWSQGRCISCQVKFRIDQGDFVNRHLSVEKQTDEEFYNAKLRGWMK